MVPIRPVFNCLIILCPTLTATTSFVSLDGLYTFMMTRKITLTLPSLKKLEISVLVLSAVFSRYSLSYDETYDKDSYQDSTINILKDNICFPRAYRY